MIKDIRAVPVFRLLSGLVAGILLSSKVHINLPLLLSSLLFLIIIIAVVYFGKMIKKPGYDWSSGLLIICFYILFGLLARYSALKEIKYAAGNIRGTFIAEVIYPPVQKEKSIRLEVEIIERVDTICDLYSGARALLYFEAPGGQNCPDLSDKFVFTGVLRTPESASNPDQFDYAAYLRTKGVFFTSFIKAGDWRIIGKNEKFSLLNYAIQVRQRLWQKISMVEPENPNLNVLYALVLGAKDYLDRETMESYTASGTMHVLSVSGLHVGLIWMVISQIILFLKKFPYGNFFYLAAGFFFLWFYALITGMSPPVVRSTIMFSLVILGKTIQKETSIYNSVFLGAFFSLLIMPDWLYNAGFQLSYSAVLGIVFFQPKIVSLFSSRFRIIKWMWELTAVSLAAQIGTISISIYYFHRFPPYFLLANMIVIPLVTIILALFICQVVSILIPFVFVFLSKLVFFLVGLMNFTVRTVEQLPSPDLNNIFMDRGQMWLILSTIIFTGFFIRYHRNIWIILILFCLLFSLVIGNVRIWKRNHSEYLVVYTVSNDFVVGMYSKGRGVLLVNTEDPEEINNRLRNNCSGFHIKHSIVSPDIVFIDSMNNYPGSLINPVKIPGEKNYFCWFMNKRIILLNDPSYFNSVKSDKTIKADIIIIGGKKKIKEEILSQRFSFEKIILSGSVPFYIRYYPSANTSERHDFIFDSRVHGAWIFSRKLENQHLMMLENYIKSLGNS